MEGLTEAAVGEDVARAEGAEGAEGAGDDTACS